MRFVAFSDIHYADYSTGVYVTDCARVERAITEHCLQNGIDVCLFCGDRYLSHEPQDYVRVLSDREQKYRNDRGIVTFSLVGNHDVYAKAPVSGHSNRHLQSVWHDVLPNIVVMDQIKTYRHPKAPGLAIHAIPACYAWDLDMLNEFDWVSGELNVLAFHDLLRDSVLDRSGYRSTKGQRIELIDSAHFHLVLGGDVHFPQRLDLTSTRGGYVGAAIQQSRRDRGSSRGWLDVDLGFDGVQTEFIEGPAPRFVEVTWDLSLGLPSAAQIEQQIDSEFEDSSQGNIVDILLSGTREALESVPEEWGAGIAIQLQSRKVNVLHKPRIIAVPIQGAAIAAQSPLEEFSLFLASNRVPLDGHDPSRLADKISPILNKVF